LAEVVQPVVVGAADGGRKLRVHVVAGEEVEADCRKQHRDIDTLHRHAYELRVGVVAGFGCKHDISVGSLAD
jgi:hypothetical protein